MANPKSKIEKAIKDEVKNAMSDFKDDEEFDLHDVNRPRLTDADRDILDFFDNLVGDGWLLKISKESPTGPSRFLCTVEKFENWGDPEIELSKIVQQKTAEEISAYGRVRSWGSGLYRVALGNRNKIRGESARVLGRHHILDIDAQEPANTQAPQNAGSDVQSLEMLKSLTVNPADIAQKMAESFKLGAEQSKGGGDAMNTLVTGLFGMITALMSNQNNKPQTDSFAEIKKLHELGLVKLPKDDDPLKSLNNLKTLMDVVQGFGGGSGGGSESSIWTEIVRKLPLDRIPDMLNSAAAIATARTVPAPVPQPVVTKAIPAQAVNSPEAEKERQMQQLMDYLYQAVTSQDAAQFPVITDSLAAYLGGKESVIEKIKSGIVNENVLVASISKMDGRYTGDMLEKLKTYAHNYIEWITKPASPAVDGLCTICGTEYEFTKEEYEKEKTKRGGKLPCLEEGCEGEVLLQNGVASE